MWGAGEVHARFAIRSFRKNDGELISGWSDGTIGVQVSHLRELLGHDSTEVAHLFITLGREDLLSEPLFDARLMKNELVEARMTRLVERIARLAGNRSE